MRIPELTRDQVPDNLKEAYDSVIAANRGSMPIGPGSLTLHSPEMASRRSPLSSFMRWEIDVPIRVQEVTILTTARALNCPYVWHAHAITGREAGVSDTMITALRENQPLPTTPEDEYAIAQYGLELMRESRVSEETFQRALAIFGSQHLVELTSLMGHYAQNAFLVNAFAVELPEDSAVPRLPV